MTCLFDIEMKVVSTQEGVLENRYIYHYCAQYQPTVGSVTYIDGIAQMENRIKDMSSYARLKELISNDHEECKGLTISSLSLIGRDND